MKHYLSIFFQKYSDIEAKDETLAHMIYSMAATLFLCVGILISLAVKCYSAFRSKEEDEEDGESDEEKDG